MNVIKNAVEAIGTEPEKITLVTEYKKERGRVLIECRDTGNGFADDQMENIFKPFFTAKPVGKGTGLGLYISHEIVRRAGGVISVRSEEGEGSVFSIELPCERADARKIPREKYLDKVQVLVYKSKPICEESK